MNFLLVLTITGTSFSYGFKSGLCLLQLMVLIWNFYWNDEADLQLQSVFQDSICVIITFQNVKRFHSDHHWEEYTSLWAIFPSHIQLLQLSRNSTEVKPPERNFCHALPLFIEGTPWEYILQYFRSSAPSSD